MVPSRATHGPCQDIGWCTPSCIVSSWIYNDYFAHLDWSPYSIGNRGIFVQLRGAMRVACSPVQAVSETPHFAGKEAYDTTSLGSYWARHQLL